MLLTDDGPNIILREDNSSKRNRNCAFDFHCVVRVSVMETVVEQSSKKDLRMENEWIQMSMRGKEGKCRRKIGKICWMPNARVC